MDRDPSRDTRRWFVGGFVILLAVVWLAWWQSDTLRSLFGEHDADPIAPIESIEAIAPAETDPVIPPLSPLADAERQWAELIGQPPIWPSDLVDPQSCEEVESELARICSILDEREPLRSVSPPGGSCGMLRTVAEALAVRQPDISSELKSYPIMLENVFHLFRVLGRERIDLLRRVQFEEQSLAEPAAMAIYRWLATREHCSRSGRTTLTTEALYDYAGFFLGTMGGQAYLRRRSPRVEALTSFYALLFIERARRENHDPAGIDPRFQIQRTRELMANQPFAFRDHYLLVLDRLAEAWKQRSSAGVRP